MIIRTPPTKKARADSRVAGSPSPDRRLVIYEDPPSLKSSDCPSEQMLCTYQCRQLVKSDFLDSLSSAEKQATDYKSKFEALNKSFQKAEAEVKKFRDQFYYAEQELAAAKGREQALQEQLLKEVNDSHERIKKQIQSYSELELKLHKEMNLRKKAESSAAAAEEKSNLLGGKLSQLSESTEREKRRLHDELMQIKRESKLSTSRLSADLEKMDCRSKNAGKESKLLKDQLEDLKRQLNECLHQKSDVEKKLSTFVCSSQEGTSVETNILVKHLQEELRNYEAEVREARKLKSSHENTMLLKEKLFEEQRRRERAESELLKIPELQLIMKTLEDELTSWKSMIKHIPDVSCSDDIPLKFAGLQKEVIASMMKVGEAETRLKQLEVALESAEVDKQNAKTEAALAEEKAEVLISELKRIESCLSLVTGERDRLKKVVIDELKKQKNFEAGDGTADGTLVKELELALTQRGNESYIKELESNLHEQQGVNSRCRDEIKLLTERLNNEARRIKSLEREGDLLRSEISILESKLGHGDFSVANTKVLRMVNTLGVDSDTKETIEALRTELQKTQEKLQAVEELKKQSADSGTLVDSYVSGKILQFKAQIATLEKREERYKSVFADRISVFRRACCELFGYKIIMDDHHRSNGIPVTRFTLQSVYAQNDDEKLEFEYESGTTSILPNDYTSQPEVSRQIEIFVQKLNSIPAFTANLTVESFNRRTLS